MQAEDTKTEYVPKTILVPMPESMRLHRKDLRKRPEMTKLAKKYGLITESIGEVKDESIGVTRLKQT